ncbi:hypothetical protein D3C87_1277340 [compost metagenome]
MVVLAGRDDCAVAVQLNRATGYGHGGRVLHVGDQLVAHATGVDRTAGKGHCPAVFRTRTIGKGAGRGQCHSGAIDLAAAASCHNRVAAERTGDDLRTSGAQLRAALECHDSAAVCQCSKGTAPQRTDRTTTESNPAAHSAGLQAMIGHPVGPAQGCYRRVGQQHRAAVLRDNAEQITGRRCTEP